MVGLRGTLARSDKAGRPRRAAPGGVARALPG